MYEQQVEAARLEVIRLIDTQRNIVSELAEIPDLLMEEQAESGRRTIDQKVVAEWTGILEGEHSKVSRLEMTCAVVGTMKAGKSTTINAIVGTEVLPNRNHPMTTVPTLIRHTPGCKEPVLSFPKPEPFQRAVKEVKAKLLKLQEASSLDSLAFYHQSDDGKETINLILGHGDSGYLHDKQTGPDAIFKYLKFLNDIARLCEEKKIGVSSPLQAYKQIEEFPVIEVEFLHLAKLKAHGTFTLIDTPGPNEVGQVYLRDILVDQLGKASSVLAVMDYTQLNSTADADVREILKDVSQLSGDRMFAFVNKYDQKNRYGMTEDEVKRHVTGELFDQNVAGERLFVGSSNYAYLANRVLTEIELRHSVPEVKPESWVEDFAELAFGTMWETDMDDLARVKGSAERLWRKSQFNALLVSVIQESFRRAGLTSVLSAAEKMLEFDLTIDSFLSMKHHALMMDVEMVKKHIEDLSDDIEKIESTERLARETADSELKRLQQKADSSFASAYAVLSTAVDEVFQQGKHAERERKEWESQQANRALMDRRIANILRNSLNQNRTSGRETKLNFNPNGPNEFSTADEAEEFLDFLDDVITTEVIEVIEKMQVSLSEQVGEMGTSLWNEVGDRLSVVLQAAEKRLTENFSVKISVPKPKFQGVKVDFAAIAKRAYDERKETYTGYTEQRHWYTLWLVKHKKSYTFNETVYTVDTRVVERDIRKQLEEQQNILKQQLHDFLNDEFMTQIERYFTSVKDYLGRFRQDLLDSVVQKEYQQERLALLQDHTKRIQREASLHRDDVHPIAEGLRV